MEKDFALASISSDLVVPPTASISHSRRVNATANHFCRFKGQRANQVRSMASLSHNPIGLKKGWGLLQTFLFFSLEASSHACVTKYSRYGGMPTPCDLTCQMFLSKQTTVAKQQPMMRDNHSKPHRQLQILLCLIMHLGGFLPNQCTLIV